MLAQFLLDPVECLCDFMMKTLSSRQDERKDDRQYTVGCDTLELNHRNIVSLHFVEE